MAHPDHAHPDHAPPLGRHRSGGRLGMVGIAAIIAAVLTTFGVGIAVLSPVFAGDPPAARTAADTTASPPDEPGGLVASEAPSTEPSTPPSVGPSASTKVSGNARYEDEVLKLVNEARADNRCRPVRMDEKLRTAARAHSTDMASKRFMSHTGSDRSSFVDRARRAGYTAAMSENVARGYRTPDAVMKGWLESSGHRRNILNCDAKAVGIGVMFGRGNEPFWTQVFGRS